MARDPELWLKELDTTLVDPCEMLAIALISVILRVFTIFFGVFLGPWVPIALKKKVTLFTPAKMISKSGFLIQPTDYWHFNSCGILTLQRLVAVVSRSTQLVRSILSVSLHSLHLSTIIRLKWHKVASYAGDFRGARFSSLPTDACSTENNIPFPSFYLRGKWTINSCAIKCWQATRDSNMTLELPFSFFSFLR